jgi:hypothetical protein
MHLKSKHLRSARRRRSVAHSNAKPGRRVHAASAANGEKSTDLPKTPEVPYKSDIDEKELEKAIAEVASEKAEKGGAA